LIEKTYNDRSEKTGLIDFRIPLKEKDNAAGSGYPPDHAMGSELENKNRIK